MTSQEDRCLNSRNNSSKAIDSRGGGYKTIKIDRCNAYQSGIAAVFLFILRKRVIPCEIRDFVSYYNKCSSNETKNDKDTNI